MKEITIQINDQPLVIKKIPLGKYADILKSVKELPKHFDKINGKSDKEIIENLPFLISECMPDIVSVIHVTTGLESSYIETELGVDDLIEIFTALLSVNNYGKIYEKIKKGRARPDTQTPITS